MAYSTGMLSPLNFREVNLHRLRESYKALRPANAVLPALEQQEYERLIVVNNVYHHWIKTKMGQGTHLMGYLSY